MARCSRDTRSSGRGGMAAPRRPPSRRPRVVVLGDLMVDVVIAPERAMAPGTDVPGRVSVRAGGSAANTARWLGRLGADVSLISAVGRDPSGRALVAAVRAEGVRPHVVRVAGHRTGRIGVVVAPDGERSFVADRGAADGLGPGDVRPAWLVGTALLHLPAYSLLGEPLGRAGRRSIELARLAGALVSLDLASAGPLLSGGRTAALAMVRDTGPDLLLATAGEAAALLGATEAAGLERERPGGDGPWNDGPWGDDLSGGGAESVVAADALVRLAPVVVIKRGPNGATVLARWPGGPVSVDVPAGRVAATDTTGAGDAFDAGFILAWLTSASSVGGGRRSSLSRLRKAAQAGHRVARQLLVARRDELPLL